MGRNKALLPIPDEGTPLLTHIVRRLQHLAEDGLIIVTNDPELAPALALPRNVRYLADAYPGAGALGGLATGLRACPAWGIFVACDMPLVNPALFAYLRRLALEVNGEMNGQRVARWDAVVPLVDGHGQPFHALYHPRCLSAIEARLAAGKLQAAGFLDQVRTRWVGEDELRPLDPALQSFTNVNTPAEWEQACVLLCESNGVRRERRSELAVR
jgi:molybdopterin-guanine dinucleotide biosynthesis protein A